MHFGAWELWLAAAFILGGAELLNGSLALLALGVACLPAALAAFLGAGTAAASGIFAASLLVELPAVAKLAQRRRSRRLATNADAIVGKRAKVLQPVSEKQEGVVLLTGEHWKARSLAGELAPGEEAQVVQRDGLLLLVIPFER
jgi:membrane protein implicated in regulation of membrane protease activity